MFEPTLSLLGEYRENVNFSHVVTYIEEVSDQETGGVRYVVYDVTLSEIDEFPDSVIFTGPSVSGHFFDSFKQTIKFMVDTENGSEYITVPKFGEVVGAAELIKFDPPRQERRTFNLLATAVHPMGMAFGIRTMIYQLIVVNDWTNGRNSLVGKVMETK